MRTILSILCATAATARAEPSNELSIGGAFRALRSTSANALTDEQLSGGQVVYARDLGLHPVPQLALWAEAAMNTGSADGALFAAFDTHVSSIALTAGVRARYALWRTLAIVGRVDAGAVQQRVELDSRESSAMSASDAGWGATATVALAVEAVAIDKPRFGLALRLEAAYVATQAVRLEAKTARGQTDDDMLQLDTRTAAFGHLDLGGPQASVSLVTRF